MVAEYYYLFLIAGVLLIAYAVWRQVKRMKDLCGCGHDHSLTEVAHMHFGQKRESFRATVFKGFFLQAVAMFGGALLVLIGLIGLIVNLTK